MAITESIIGADQDTTGFDTGAVAPSVIALIDSVLGDDGTTTVTDGVVFGNSAAVQGTRADGTQVAGVLPSAGGASGTLSDGTVDLGVNLPANVALTSQGPATEFTTNEGVSYLQGLVNSAYGSREEPIYQQETNILNHAARLVSNRFGNDTDGADDDVGDGGFRVVQLVEQGNGGGVTHVALQATNNDVLGIGIDPSVPHGVVSVRNAGGVVVVGNGTVRADNPNGVALIGNVENQALIGGVGNDTLVGGAGQDTLIGGAGDDVFGFVDWGRFRLSDFDPTQDRLSFSLEGVDSLEQLGSRITSVERFDNGFTVHFGDAGSITLLGVSTDDISADMISFDL